jgi:tRNA(Ile2) C34 agmatinyltransferase TiaS
LESKVIYYIGIDDTDTHESRGTGHLARGIAQELSKDFVMLGVTRHQLLFDPRIPYTSHNSSAAICIQNGKETDIHGLFERVKALMLADFIPGSDPGLCLAPLNVALALTGFARRAQKEVVTQVEARLLAEKHGVLLEGLGGSQDGVIGAAAAVGLAAYGEDGRYVLVGNSRDLVGLQKIADIQATGITAVLTLDGKPVDQGLVLADKLRPARRNGQPVLYVEWQEDHWQPLKLD